MSDSPLRHGEEGKIEAEDDKQLLNFYQKLEKLGEGTFGVVYKAKDTRTNEFVALKRVKIDAAKDGVPGTTIREIVTLKELDHPHIVKLLEVMQKDYKRIFLVFEHIDQDLRQYIDSLGNQFMPPITIKSFIQQLVKATHYMHGHRVIHRDLKPQNILVAAGGHLKLADFGLARMFGLPRKTYTSEIETLWYRSPELLLGETRYHAAVDVWSLGCILAEMVSKKPLFKGDSEIDQLFSIFKMLGTPTEEDWPGLSALPDYKASFPFWSRSDDDLARALTMLDVHGMDLLVKLLILDPDQRISARQASSHRYLSDVATVIGAPVNPANRY